MEFTLEIITKAALAERLIGKPEGITHILTNSEFFLKMYVIKDATNSSQIEGIRVTMMVALEMKQVLT